MLKVQFPGNLFFNLPPTSSRPPTCLDIANAIERHAKTRMPLTTEASKCQLLFWLHFSYFKHLYLSLLTGFCLTLCMFGLFLSLYLETSMNQSLYEIPWIQRWIKHSLCPLGAPSLAKKTEMEAHSRWSLCKMPGKYKEGYANCWGLGTAPLKRKIEP